MNHLDIDCYRDWLLSNPSAFVEGVRGFCKQAAKNQVIVVGGNTDDDDSNDNGSKSLWDAVKPWVLGLGGGYLALKAGDKWGRHAQLHGYKDGPVLGPIKAGLGAFLPPNRGTIS